MPVNKNFLNRLLAIHEILGSGRHCDKYDLLRACTDKIGCDCSERALYKDLRELKDVYGAPIPENDRSGKPYYYTRPFSLFAVLNPTDATLANEAVALVRQMQTLPQFAGLETILLKFEQQPGVIGRAGQSVVQFEQNPQYTGLRWLQPLYQTIQDNCQTLLTYTDFGDETMRFTFSPYLLKEYNNRWHCYGWAEERNALTNLALDRIDALTPLPNLRRRADATDWAAYTADQVGFTRVADAPIEVWRLRVWLPRARYVETKPLHGSQQIVSRTESHVDFQYRLRWNREFDALILELGSDAELLAPQPHRERLAHQIGMQYKKYLMK